MRPPTGGLIVLSSALQSKSPDVARIFGAYREWRLRSDRFRASLPSSAKKRRPPLI